MTANGWIQIAIFALLVTATVKPLGLFMAKVFNGERTFLSPVLRPVERMIYALCGVDEKQEQHWTTYTIAMLVLQHRRLCLALCAAAAAGVLPFNPHGLGAVSARLARSIPRSASSPTPTGKAMAAKRP